MTHVKVKVLIAATVVIGAVVLLALAGAREGWVYYLPVDDFIENPDHQTKRVRLHGIVSDRHLEVGGSGLEASFDLLGEMKVVRVSYAGVVPDQFQADREVVVEGQLDDVGVFQADTLLTKCASKYESAEGESTHDDPRSGETSG